MWIFLYLLHYPVFEILHQSVATSVSRPCRLPPEYNQMPDFAKEKLRSICFIGEIIMQMHRQNYKSGKSCVAEQIATDVVLTAVNIFPAKHQHKETFELPEFLNDASKDIINNFTKVWNDADIPSEGLREEMIHLLAVSLLTTKQLTAYNQYTKERRRCQRQLLFHIRQMSNEARKALNILAYAEPNERFGIAKNFPRSIRHELRNFARRRSEKCI
ncbi:unnamed protein product [Acanthocheilonema viteae]|uniref:NR LBD domain-containing protein n=1 Tax=Acanthocheilonema viteae TaxID=6277 RepID=A0A498S5B7_ACAVI|nr:unnamed protein product [Acanthocheilonema viteae]